MNKLSYIVPAALMLAVVLLSCTSIKSNPTENNPVDADYSPIELTSPPSPTVCPITDEEIVMLAKTMYAEAQVVYWDGTRYGVSYTARQAAVAWVALNRYDEGTFGRTLAEVLSKPGQFAYDPDTQATEHMLWLAEDVVTRWWAEQQGETDVGRTLPADYLFFDGNGRENHFRQQYEKTDRIWDWSLPDPYEEVTAQ